MTDSTAQLIGTIGFLTVLLACLPGLAKFAAIVVGSVIFAFLVAGMAQAIGLVPFLLVCLLIQGMGRLRRR